MIRFDIWALCVITDEMPSKSFAVSSCWLFPLSQEELLELLLILLLLQLASHISVCLRACPHLLNDLKTKHYE